MGTPLMLLLAAFLALGPGELLAQPSGPPPALSPVDSGPPLSLPEDLEGLWWGGRWDELAATLEARRRTREWSAHETIAWARLLLARGETRGAVEALDPWAEVPGPTRPLARWWRAEAFHALGLVSRATLEWQDFVRDWRAGSLRDPDGLMLVARACHRLDAPQDANRLFREVLAADPDHWWARIHWAELFLDRYRPDEAAALLDEALQVRPDHPHALMLRARAALDHRYDVPLAQRLLSLALALHPDHPESLEILAELAMERRRWEEARTLLDRAESRTPGRMGVLALRAGLAMLRGDAVGLDRAVEEAERRLPTLAPVYARIGQIATRGYRYPEALAWHRRAREADAGYWPNHAPLAIAFSRSGDEERALRFLREAYREDPFHLQTFHMVELYESALRAYDFLVDPLLPQVRYRLPRTQRVVLERMVPPVVQSAWNRYRDLYGLTPPGDLSVEIFHDQATFGIRSVGVPSASQHGICFGHLVTARSPVDGTFNWQLVLEHELSHVFSLHASDWRVPRWFSEGLAEFDTWLADPRWRREQDLSLVGALREGRLPGIAMLDDAFVSVEDMGLVMTAYAQSALLVEYLHEQGGRAALLRLLDGWRQGHDDASNLIAVFGQPVAVIEEGFITWLRNRLSDVLEVWEPSLSMPRSADACAEAVAEGQAAAWAACALHHLQQRRPDAALEALVRARAEDAAEPLALYLLGLLRQASGDAGAALDAWMALEALGVRSHSVLLHAADALESLGRQPEATAMLERAAARWPRDAVSRARLAGLAEEDGNRQAATRWWREVVALDENQVAGSWYLAQSAAREGDWTEVAESLAAVLQVAPFRGEVHRLAAEAARHLGQTAMADSHLTMAWDLGDRNAAEARALVEALLAAGMTEEAARWQSQRPDPGRESEQAGGRRRRR